MNKFGISEELLEKAKQFIALDASLNARDPELADIHTLRAKEVLNRIASDSDELRKQFDMWDQAISGMFTDLFLQFPLKLQRGILICIRNNMLMLGWSAKFCDQILSELMQESEFTFSIADIHICPHCGTTECYGPSELCSADWKPCGCNDFNYPCDSSHSTLRRCRNEKCVDYLKQYRVCAGHKCIPK